MKWPKYDYKLCPAQLHVVQMKSHSLAHESSRAAITVVVQKADKTDL